MIFKLVVGWCVHTESSAARGAGVSAAAGLLLGFSPACHRSRRWRPFCQGLGFFSISLWVSSEEAIEWAGTEQLWGYFGLPKVVLVAFPKRKRGMLG